MPSLPRLKRYGKPSHCFGLLGDSGIVCSGLFVVEQARVGMVQGGKQTTGLGNAANAFNFKQTHNQTNPEL